MFTQAQEVIDFIAQEEIAYIDVRFCDLPGVQQHFTIPASELEASVLKDGLMFDGSSIRGFTAIHESDMKLVPDVTTAFLDPFREEKTLVVNFSIVDPFTDEVYSRDPRSIAAKAEDYLRSTGIADTCYIGAEAEFYLFDSVRYEASPAESFYAIDSCEAAWNTGREEEGGNKGYKTAFKGGYFPVSPNDQMADIRDRMVRTCLASGLEIERAHHEVGTAGQQEINYRFSSLLAAGDDMMKFKYIIKNEAWRNGKTATFMPKPIFGDNGSGMHVHMSIWKDGTNLFNGDKYAGLSDFALFYIGGIIKHARALNAITNPSTNSYKRLVPHYEAPVKLAYSARNRSASIRIPFVNSPKARRIEARFPDPVANPYLAFAALMMAGLDGVQNRIHPGDPAEKNLYDLPPEEDAKIPTVCHALEQALEALDRDREFLTRGGVFDNDMIDAFITLKMEEVTRLRMVPHPIEFDMYYSC